MIALYLVAAHLLGDFVLQSRWMARGKLDHADTRALHVLVYALTFVPIAVYYAPSWRGAAFLSALYVLHFATDSRRFRSTVGDWIAWRIMVPAARADELQENRLRDLRVGEYHSAPALLFIRLSDEAAARAKVPPNPWAPTSILVDQTLHLCQLAILGGLFLR